MQPGPLDVIVVGGGPAGLSAALVLARACRRVAVFDEGKPRNAVSRGVHNFLSRDGVPPAELLAISREQLARYPNLRFVRSRVVDASRAPDGGFEVVTDDGERVRGRKLILATGMVERLPPVTGLRALYGRGVFSCPYCDGWELRGQTLAVYGRDDARGGEFALELLGWSRDLVLCTDGPSDLSGPMRARLARHGVRVLEDRVVSLTSTDGALDGLSLASGAALRCRALFVLPELEEASDLATRLDAPGARRDQIEVKRHGRAGVPGLFVVGDASRDVLQVAVAAGEGCEAAITVNCELLREEFR